MSRSVHILHPRTRGVRTGNMVTAERLATLLGDEHRVTIGDALSQEPVDVLVVLHAVRGADAIRSCRDRSPRTRIVLVLTGTDIHAQSDRHADVLLASMSTADRLVVLQPLALQDVPAPLRARTSVIVQSVPAMADLDVPPRSIDPFVICVVGHLRDVKDPMRAAAASRLLPAGSHVIVRHAGGVLDRRYADMVRSEMSENPRYQHFGELPAAETRRLIGSSQAMVLSSRSEGGPGVVGEAVVAGTPVIASRVPGAIGLLGDAYPGYFPVGDTAALASLIERLERDSVFRNDLREACDARASLFAPQLERRCWLNLLADLES